MTLAGIDIEEMDARQMSGVLLATFAESAANLEVALEVLTPDEPKFVTPTEPKTIEDLRASWGMEDPAPLKERMLPDA